MAAVLSAAMVPRKVIWVAAKVPAESKAGKPKVFRPALRLMAQNMFAHNVGKNAAGLAYYLLFALFPLLIFLNNLLGLLDLNVTAITETLQQFLPRDVVGIIESYLDYVSHTSSHSLMWFSLVFSIWFPLRATKGLMNDVRLAYHLDKPARPGAYLLRQLIYTLLLLLVIGLTLLLSTFGKQVLGHISVLLPESARRFFGYFLGIWQYLRFLPIGVLMFAALGGLYSAAMDQRQPMKAIRPGILFALAAWMIVSVCFSFYVENFANYSVVYGTLGAVIVLLMWLYMTAVILILGAELNAALLSVRDAGSGASDGEKA